MRTVDIVTLLLVIVGAVNWGLVGLFEFDLVATITGDDFGETNPVSRIIYILVGVSGLYQISLLARLFNREPDRVTVTQP
ncbi:MAG TPA: DUF378 domain-containing protein [Thermomicrobiales bacterium]|jgi:uncharacterized membrane protein YuzA (DUF378 family)|nr:DUF378 domain-containing protein [Thermomicrobiales bacterium]